MADPLATRLVIRTTSVLSAPPAAVTRLTLRTASEGPAVPPAGETVQTFIWGLA